MDSTYYPCGLPVLNSDPPMYPLPGGKPYFLVPPQLEDLDHDIIYKSEYVQFPPYERDASEHVKYDSNGIRSERYLLDRRGNVISYTEYYDDGDTEKIEVKYDRGEIHYYLLYFSTGIMYKQSWYDYYTESDCKGHVRIWGNYNRNGTKLKIYDKHKKLISERRYMNGLLDGYFTEYYLNGNPRAKGHYEHGQLSGSYKEYDSEGNVTFRTKYYIEDIKSPGYE